MIDTTRGWWVPGGHTMSVPDSVDGVTGTVILAAGVAHATLTRRDLDNEDQPQLARRVFDPQLYLATLYAGSSEGPCANLASYGWFPLTQPMPQHDSAEMTQNDWKTAVRENIADLWMQQYPTGAEVGNSIRRAVEFQASLGVEAVILPAPLTDDPFSDFATESEWLRQGVKIAGSVAREIPAFATVALSDAAVRTRSPWANPLLDIIVDQVTSRNVRGVYLVMEHSADDGYYISHPSPIGALLRLTHDFTAAGLPVMVNYAGTAGLMLLAAGAYAWCTGWMRSERRLNLAAFEKSGGRMFPAYYAHRLASEIHLQKDLDTLVAAGLLGALAYETPASRQLLRALKQGKGVGSVPEWKYRMNNRTASREHFYHVMTRETAAVGALGDVSKVRDATQAWLEAALALARQIKKLPIGGLNDRTALEHQHGWVQAFREYRTNRQV